MRHLILVALLGSPALAQTTEKGNSTGTSSTKAPPDEDGTPKLSLPTEEDRLAWQRSGFRLGLGILYGRFEGLGGAPSGRLLGAHVRAGLRLDASWSIMTTLEYASASARGGLSGLRFAGTIDPTWHVTPSFSLALGIGFGGIVEGRTNRMAPDPATYPSNTSFTFPDAKTPLASCSGVGLAGLARADYAWVLGPRSQTSVSFEVIAQDTGCVQRSGTVDPDTAAPIELHQYWSHVGATLAWGITWR
jgi:hypothetical protein